MVMLLRRWLPQRPLVLVGDNGYAVLDLRHCCQSLREPVTLIADEAIWGWVRQEATANQCQGTRAVVREKVDGFFADLSHRKEEVKRRCRTVLQAKADELIGEIQANPPRIHHVGFTLALV